MSNLKTRVQTRNKCHKLRHPIHQKDSFDEEGTISGDKLTPNIAQCVLKIHGIPIQVTKMAINIEN